MGPNISKYIQISMFQLKESICQLDIFFPIGSMYGIFTYIWLKFILNIGKYTSPMDPMGLEPLPPVTNHGDRDSGFRFRISSPPSPPPLAMPMLPSPLVKDDGAKLLVPLSWEMVQKKSKKNNKHPGKLTWNLKTT